MLSFPRCTPKSGLFRTTQISESLDSIYHKFDTGVLRFKIVVAKRGTSYPTLSPARHKLQVEEASRDRDRDCRIVWAFDVPLCDASLCSGYLLHTLCLARPTPIAHDSFPFFLSHTIDDYFRLPRWADSFFRPYRDWQLMFTATANSQRRSTYDIDPHPP